MKPVTPAEVKSLEDYEIARATQRSKILGIKASRRIAVGEAVTVLFENHETVLYQIQEMLRAEHVADPKAIEHEVDTYNELVGGKDELGATLLIEYADPVERDRRLRELVGIENHVRLEVEGYGVCPARFDMRQMNTERVSSVQYVRFPLGRRLADAVRAGAGVAIVIDHPKLGASGKATPRQVAALAADLAT